MLTDNGRLYAAFKARDARFDGRFFVGVSSTKIYCRPVCRAKQPKFENCAFYQTAAQAEKDGYRPCLLCRPELAPGCSITDANANLAWRAAKMLEKNCGSGQSLDELAGRLGYTDRHLRRVFMAQYNVSPVQYLQTCRLLLAKNLLTDTNLPGA
ncbi:MAG: helix-turn-helix domain-containing protein [Oscillospiraceae bacterium]|nr:helix-turn-helix domain-containing protein [Oscillospiraceae bacterium]